MCVILALTVMAGATSCNSAKLDHWRLARFISAEHYYESHDVAEFKKWLDASDMSEYVGTYVSLKGDESQEFFDDILNEYKVFDDLSLSKTTAFIESDTGRFYFVYLMTFAGQQDAYKFVNTYIASMLTKNRQMGEINGYSYFTSGSKIEGYEGWYSMDGVYVENTTVFVIRATTKDPGFVNTVCDEFNVIAPVIEQ